MVPQCKVPQIIPIIPGSQWPARNELLRILVQAEGFSGRCSLQLHQDMGISHELLMSWHDSVRELRIYVNGSFFFNGGRSLKNDGFQ